MDRFVSEPIPNPAHAQEAAFQRADLVFYGVDHSGPSFEARVFFNQNPVNVSTPRNADTFAGSFTVFGHVGCAGDAGHCHVPTSPRDPFDRRPPHHLTPQTKTVIVTDALRRVSDAELTISVIAIRPGPEVAEMVDGLYFERFTLLTYS
jgi:hypothetical protein